ncbi:MAG: xanthine dehydrogenase family protein subunit M [Chloroflexota bacterium]
MIPAAFEYRSPASVDEALSLLSQHGDDAKILAGGHSLIPLMRLRLAAPSLLIDLSRIPDLNYIRDDGDHIAIGAMTPYADLITSHVVRERAPLLAQSASLVGDPQVRYRGTLGGALAHADPAGDMPAVVCALGGHIVARGSGGERTIDMPDFFQDIFTSALRPDEILTEIRLHPQTGGGNYQKFTRRAMDWALVGAAVNLTRSNGSVAEASVYLTNVGPRPMRATSVEGALRGGQATPDVFQRAAERAADDIDPSGDLYSTPEYKRHLAKVMVRRALEAATG